MNLKFVLIIALSLTCSISFAQIDSHFWSLKTPALNGQIQNSLPEAAVKSFSYIVTFDHGSYLSSLSPWGSSSTYQTETFASGQIAIHQDGSFQLPAVNVSAPLKLVAKRNGKAFNIKIVLQIEVNGQFLEAYVSRAFSGYIDYSESLDYLVKDLKNLKIGKSDDTYIFYQSNTGTGFNSVQPSEPN